MTTSTDSGDTGNDATEQLQEFFEVRRPGADLAEHGGFRLEIDCSFDDFTLFPRLDDSVRYPKGRLDTRAEARDSLNLADYSGPFRSDLSLYDFAPERLVRMIQMNHEYYVLTLSRWWAQVQERWGHDVCREIQAAAWRDGVLPHLERIVGEWNALPVTATPVTDCDALVEFNPFAPDPRHEQFDKQRLVQQNLGCHEFFLLVMESWAGQVVVRYGLDAMFAIQWDLWSDDVLPEVRAIKMRGMNISGDGPEAFIKDIQCDATSFPGKAFDMIFDMPAPDVAELTFNRCCAVDQWEAMGRTDILEKGCHSTCPASLIETAKMYHPNMKVDILAIPPRVDADAVCCKWRLSMRTPDDPEYVPVAISPKP